MDVTDHGARGDGVALDHDAVASAVTAAGPGGVVRFPPGAYVVARLLRPLDGQTWLLAGARLVRAPRSPYRLVQADTVTGWTMLGGTLDGNAVAQRERCTALVSLESGSRGCVLRDVTVVDAAVVDGFDPSADAALRLVDATDCRVERCRVARVGYGVVVGSDAGSTGTSARCTVRGLLAEDVAANVVFVSGSLASVPGPATVTDHLVEDVLAARFHDACVEIGQGALGCRVARVRADGGGAGQHVVLVRDNRGTVVEDVLGTGLREDAPGAGLLSVLPMYGAVEDLRARAVG